MEETSTIHTCSTMEETSTILQLGTIYEAVKSNTRVHLYGPQGVGKTWMANKVSDRCARERLRFFRSVLWVFLCRDHNVKSLSESMARQLGLLPTTEDEEWIVDDDWEGEKDDVGQDGKGEKDVNEAENSEALIQQLREKLQGGKVLVFLDDVYSDEENEKEKEDNFRSMWGEILPAHIDAGNLHTVLISRSRCEEEEGTSKKIIEVNALPKEESESLLIQKLDAQLTSSVVTLGKQFIEKSKRFPSEVIMIAKALNYFGLDESGVSMLRKELEETSETYEIKGLLCRMHNALPIGVLKDLCQPTSHFFRDSGSIHYNELITYWILEGYLGIGSMIELYEKGHHVLMELMDCSLIKRQEGGYVFMDKSVLSADDLYQCVDQIASLGLATVYTSESDTKGFGLIVHEDGMLKASHVVKKEQKKSRQRSSKVEDPKLRTLLLDGTHFNEKVLMGFLESQKELQLLALFNPTIKSLPEPLLMMKSLRVLVLRGCEFLQNVKLPFDDLLVLEISGATSLKKIPFKFFKNMPKLQSLNLSKLPITSLPSSICRLTELRWLIIKDCPSLKKLGTLADLKHLKVLDLSGNTSLASIDKNFVELRELRSLNLSNTMLPTTPILKNSEELKHLLVRSCPDLGRSRGLTSLTNLQTLDISGSTLFEDFHDLSLESLVSLKTLDLSGTNLDLLPSNIGSPRYLNLKGCTRLKELSCTEPLLHLEILDVSGSKNLDKINEELFNGMKRLRVLNLSETNVAVLPSVSNLSDLRELLLSGCASLVRLPTLESVTKLEVLDVSHCSALEDIGNSSFERMSRLEKLDLSETKIKSLPSLPHPSNLRQLLLNNTTNLQNLQLNASFPNLVELNLSGITSLAPNGAEFLKDISSLQILDLSCTSLVRLPSMSALSNLSHLFLAGCKRLEAVPDLDSLTKLEVLDLSGSSVKNLPNISHLSNLRKVLLKDCSMVEEFPDEINDVLGLTTKIPHQISESSHIEYLEFPNIRDINSHIEYLDQWNICQLSDNDKPPIFFSGVHESGDKYLWRHELVFADVYLRARQFARYMVKRSLQIRGFTNSPIGIENVISHVDVVFMIDDKFKSLISGLSASVLSNLKGCWIERCNEMVNVFDEKEAENDPEAGIALENLGISTNSRLESIYNGKKPFGGFNNLKTLYLDCCPKLSTVFSSSWLPETLEVLQIKYCDKLVSLFDGEGKLPNLETLHLWELPELESIGISFPSLQTLKIWNCPKVNQIEDMVKFAKGLKVLWISGATNLKSLYNGDEERCNFINLKSLKLESCPTLVNVISSGLPPENIEMIEIRDCEKLRTLFAESNSVLRCLNRLYLEYLPLLESIGAILPPLENALLIVCLSDLEADYMNPYDSSSRINAVVIPEMLLHGVCCALFLFTGHWFIYSKKRHLIDVTEAFRFIDGERSIGLLSLPFT
ncbi:hypothetical protein OSB04_020978 [Centaurea solstitialis]|uniref:NB-ARC domain-containing protein n=1 Tax=Centaurea solstitialis TaxID=347529 RepID=A0AA38WDT4_9ASTR|nr:hypothetical protein OSB04_020978 [Centaurea solstitialis]